jgi:NitT/TauT family transport system permease protein
MRSLNPHGRARRILLPLALLGGLIFIWEVGARLLHIRDFLLPLPSAIVLRFMSTWSILAINTLWTTLEALGGLALGTCIALVVATTLHFSRTLDTATRPFLAASQSFPKEALAPLLVLWFGFGLSSKIVLSALIAFFPIFVACQRGFRSAPTEVNQLLHAIKAHPRFIFAHVQFPFALPFIFSGLRVAAVLALIGAVIGEFMGSSVGLGNLILLANSQFKTDLVFGCLVILAFIGGAFDLVIRAAETYAIPWHESLLETSSPLWAREAA